MSNRIIPLIHLLTSAVGVTPDGDPDEGEPTLPTTPPDGFVPRTTEEHLDALGTALGAQEPTEDENLRRLREALEGPRTTPPPDENLRRLQEAIGGTSTLAPTATQTAISQYSQLAQENIRQLGLTRNAGGYYDGPEAGWYYPQWNGEMVHVAPPPAGPPAPAPGTLGTIRVYRGGRWVAMPATSPTLPATIYTARLGLRRQADGSFTREGQPGSYYIMPNGSLYYTGGVRPREGAEPERLPPKILTITDGVLQERAPTDAERDQLPLAFAIGRLGLFPNADGTFTHPGTAGAFRIHEGNLIYEGTGTPPGSSRTGRQRYNLDTRAWVAAPAPP